MALVLPFGGLGLADSEWPKPTEALSECLNDSILLSASENELSQNYLTRLDTAMVLCFQAGYENPEKPEIWKRLAFLAETKSFFVTDPKDRDDLMDEAAAHYRHSASLEYERASQAFLDYSEKAPTLGLSDPYLNELVWLGRMRRGEVTMAEIYQRHSAENLEPIHKPEFWEELAQLIQSERDPAKREKELGSAREEFKKLWDTMPVEVPWRGLADKFGPQKLKKVEALEAWAAGLVSIASQLESSEERQALFLEAIELYSLSLKMPLDLFEFTALGSQLDQAELLAPGNDSLLALWALKDSLFELIAKKFPNELSVWSAWGRDFYARSNRQADYRVWLSYFQTAGDKFQTYVDKSPKPSEALNEWGSFLENSAYPDLSYLSVLDNEDRANRVSAILDLALDKYRKAMEIDPEMLGNIRALSSILLRLSTFKPLEEFGDLLDESDRLAFLAISRDPNSAAAWLQRGLDTLAFSERGRPVFEAKSRLTAEAFSAFRQYLSSNPGQVKDLREMADRVWRAAETMPGLRRQGLQLLVDICQRLIVLGPNDPDYRFALGLSLYSLLATSPNWPDDLVFSDSLSAREAFEAALVNFESGLSLLSDLERDAPTLATLGLENSRIPLPRPQGWPNSESREFLSRGELVPVGTLLSAGFQNRFSAAAKLELSRLVTASRPDLLPPWYQYRLGAMFRRVASSGYPSPIDQMAFYRLSEQYLSSALEAYTEATDSAASEGIANPLGAPSKPTLKAIILAEKGLLFSEMSILAENDKGFLLESAEVSWDLAEKDSPGSSRYARARWAAWTETPELLAPWLSHTVEEQANLLWPSLREAALEPAFRDIIGQRWFKVAWFGYSR